MNRYSAGHTLQKQSASASEQPQVKGDMNMWTKPEVTEMRFGFEVTMYVCNR
jgi:pyrroloquinoline quinone biosynthesis protein A